jgi:hypothetical protein
MSDSPMMFEVVVDDDEIQLGGKGLLDSVPTMARKVVRLDPSKLSAEMQSLCLSIDSMFHGVTRFVGGYELDSFELTVEITAKGEIRLLGSAGMEAKGGLKLSFRRGPR